ncbi:hypothetical protein INR49_023702 [Caranx melampygus]|nr:hypothetical protein INR49_023702 [Caranx melampygus]
MALSVKFIAKTFTEYLEGPEGSPQIGLTQVDSHSVDHRWKETQGDTKVTARARSTVSGEAGTPDRRQPRFTREKADWTFLEHLLEEGQEYSTGIGRVWLTVLFLFRMLVLGTAAESAWDDEQAGFVCNTKQPGCTAVCYDKAFPISHFRYFVLQVIIVSTPTIFYFGYVAIRARKDKDKEKEKAEEGGDGSKGGETVVKNDTENVTKNNAEETEKKEDCGKGRKVVKAPPELPKLKGRLLCAYAISILFKVVLEAGFIIGLWLLYDGFFMQAKFECVSYPCPHIVDCFVSRPTEKTIFTIYTQVIAAISLFLNLIELLHLLQIAISHKLEKHYHAREQDCRPWSEQVPAARQTPELTREPSHPFQAGSHVNIPMQGGAVCYPKPLSNGNFHQLEVIAATCTTGVTGVERHVNVALDRRNFRLTAVTFLVPPDWRVKDLRHALELSAHLDEAVQLDAGSRASHGKSLHQRLRELRTEVVAHLSEG